MVPVRPDESGKPDLPGEADPAGGSGETMSWWQDGAADDRATADDVAVDAVEQMAAEQFPALVIQGLLLTGDRDVAHDLVYEALARLRRDWYRLSDAELAPAYLRGAVTSLARERRADGGETMSGGQRAPTGAAAASPPVVAEAGADHDADADDEAEADDVKAGPAPVDIDPATAGTAPEAPDVRAALAAVAPAEREGLVLRHHLHLPDHEAALCLCTAVAPLQALVDGGIGQLRAVLGAPVAGYDDVELAALVASAGSDVVATLNPQRLADALSGSRRIAAVGPRRRRRADAAWLLLGVLVGGAVAIGAVWHSHQGATRRVATKQASVTTIVGRKASTTVAGVVITLPATTAAANTVAPTTIAPTTIASTTATTLTNDVLAVAVTPIPTEAPIPTATTRASAPSRTTVATPGSATTAQTAPPVPTASPTTVPAPATTPAPVTPAPTLAPTDPPTTTAKVWSLGLYGCARSDSSFFVNGTANPSSGSVVVSGTGFSFTSSISASGSWRVAGTVAGAAQGSISFRAATTGRGGSASTSAACSA